MITTQEESASGILGASCATAAPIVTQTVSMAPASSWRRKRARVGS
ncbi:hypothetical protein [Brachybacterium sp. sponge]|nr:hypothetical protein [Brachybacterium sp. sponge]